MTRRQAFCGWIIFHVLHFLYCFIHYWYESRLTPHLSYCERCCNKQGKFWCNAFIPPHLDHMENLFLKSLHPDFCLCSLVCFLTWGGGWTRSYPQRIQSFPHLRTYLCLWFWLTSALSVYCYGFFFFESTLCDGQCSLGNWRYDSEIEHFHGMHEILGLKSSAEKQKPALKVYLKSLLGWIQLPQQINPSSAS